ncbi:MAG: glycine cleavage system aminomethyltransferase GcvT [Bacteroidales bacterium]
MSTPKRTSLYDAHLRHGGKIVEFAGWELPIQYEKTGIITEHNAVRNAAGLFDVSHMGEFMVEGPGAISSINHLITNDVTVMQPGGVIYSLMCNESGGVVDDLLVYKFTDTSFLLVVNAANIDKDYQWVEEHLLPETTLKNISSEVGQIALQGPIAEEVLTQILPKESHPSKNYTFVETELEGVKCILSRTGYTGEDGFEIYCEPSKIEVIFEKLLAVGAPMGVVPCGLGCRDTLRFEAGMPLYGHELGDSIPANEVGLGFCIKMAKADFIGKAALEAHTAKYIRRGVILVDKGIAREHALVYKDGREVGYVTTGTFSPTNNVAMAMVRVEKGLDAPVEIEVRNRRLKADFIKLPFIQKNNNK